MPRPHLSYMGLLLHEEQVLLDQRVIVHLSCLQII
jgi:hypothetical protein